MSIEESKNEIGMYLDEIGIPHETVTTPEIEMPLMPKEIDMYLGEKNIPFETVTTPKIEISLE
ncbi:MAG TPA: hypothetical protein DEP72_02185 [Clostridiales bacterium]|nr:MAG: hypothetical protein A2Y18_00375 [Clostridiales bacterium GWD2_32_19]HCC06965.1 hypothetical protein [Clostridiales bacterium]